MTWPPSRPPAPQCQFSACTSTMCLRSFRTLWQTTALNYSILDDESRETWLCPPHDRLVNDALQRRYKDLGIKVRRSREGWVWIDNLTHIVFGWTP